MNGVGVLEAGKNGVGEACPAAPPNNIEAPLPSNIQARVSTLPAPNAPAISNLRPRDIRLP